MKKQIFVIIVALLAALSLSAQDITNRYAMKLSRLRARAHH